MWLRLMGDVMVDGSNHGIGVTSERRTIQVTVESVGVILSAVVKSLGLC